MVSSKNVKLQLKNRE